MGKILTIIGADFSKNGMIFLNSINLSYIEGTDSFQFVANPTDTYWDGNTGKTVVNGGTPITPVIQDLKSNNTIDNNYYWLAFGSETYGDKLKTAEIVDQKGLLTNMKCMFVKCRYLDSVVLEGKPTNMHGLFHNCERLVNVDLSGLDTSRVSNMQDLFRKCESLQSVDLSNFDTSNVTNMYSMFSDCKKLSNLNLSNFNTSKVGNMRGMFSNDTSLSVLDLSNFDTSNVTNMQNMFGGTNKLQLDLSNFNTSKVTNMQSMFSGNSSDVIDLRSFDMSNVTNIGTMFYDGLTSKGPKVIKFGPNLSLAKISNTDVGFLSYCSAIERIECSSLTSSDSAISKLKLLVSSSTNANLSNSIDLVCSDRTLHWNGSSWN